MEWIDADWPAPADDEGRPCPLPADQADHLQQGGGGVADGDQATLDQSQAMGLAHGLDGAGAVLGTSLADDVLVLDEVMDPAAEMGQPCPGYADGDHLHVGNDGPARAEGSDASTDRGRVKARQAVEVKIGRGMDQAPHQGPLLRGIAMPADFAIHDSEGGMLDMSASLGQLLRDPVLHSPNSKRTQCRPPSWRR